jgi:ethanolamine utilization protein EutA
MGLAHLLSVGIDIGTTTTHLVVSRLTFANDSLPSQAPNLAIVGREILYESAVFLTPLVTGELGPTIDSKAVAEIVSGAYAAANLTSHDIQSGALIITGESARIRNARAISEELAHLAGAFVCESAGPNMECYLAARGSQAVETSRFSSKAVLNIDIGGGTSNYALIRRGIIESTAALNIGGRCLQFTADNKLAQASYSGMVLLKRICPQTNWHEAAQGAILCEEQLNSLANLMAQEILDTAHGKGSDLLLTEPLSYNKEGCAATPDEFEIVFSGGVAALMEQAGADNNFPYGDMGLYLARALIAAMAAKPYTFRIAPRAIRATVIGAGMHSLQLSGSTVGFKEEDLHLGLLPLRNLKLIKLKGAMLYDMELSLSKQCRIKEIDITSEHCAVYLDLPLTPRSSDSAEKSEDIENKSIYSFSKLKHLADQLSDSFSNLQGRQPLVVLCQPDLAMALALLLENKNRSMKIITVDGVNAELGDYVDIGLPVSTSDDSNTKSLPVVIKTLVFYKSAD